MLGFRVDELVLEFANREMAEVDILGEIAAAGRDVAAGVIDVKNYHLEIAGRGRRADRCRARRPASPPSASTLVPDCGFSQTARWATRAKLRALVAGRDLVRGRAAATPSPRRDTGGGTHGRPPDLDARHRAHRRLLHHDAARPAQPRPGRGRLFAQRRARARRSASAGRIPESTTDLQAAVEHPDTDVVVVGLPNFLHEEAVGLAAAAGKAVLCTKPLGRTAEEARRMLEVVESAGVFAGYLEDLCYTPKTLKAIASVEAGAIGDVTWVRSRETHPGPHSALVLGRPADRRRRDHRPRLPLHRDHPQLRRQGKPAGRGDVPRPTRWSTRSATRTTRSR